MSSGRLHVANGWAAAKPNLRAILDGRSTPQQFEPPGEAHGNFPQAFTHLALISCAVNLDRALDR